MDPFHVARLAGDAWTAAGAGSSRTFMVTAVAPVIRSTAPDGPFTPATTCSPTGNASA